MLTASMGQIKPLRHCFLLLGICCCALILQASNLHAENLNDTLAQAYRYNPQLDAQRATLRATDEDVSRANSGYRPSINASADVGRQRIETRPDFGNSGTTSPRGFTVQAVQPIFRGFRTTNAVNAAEAAVRAGREQLRSVEQQVLLNAVTAYADVVQTQAIVKLREDNLRFVSVELKATQERFAVGEVTRTDVAQSQASVALSRSNLDQAKADLKSARARYEQVVGSQPRNLAKPSLTSKLVPRSLDEAIGIGTRENPAVVGALYAEQAQRFQVDEIRGELLPEAQIEATYTDRYDSSRQTEQTETSSIVGRVNVPIYANGGEVYARVRQAKQTHLARLQDIETARAQSQSQVAQSWSQLVGFKAQLESDKAEIESNTIALNGVREEEKVGQRTRIEVLDQQLRLLLSQEKLETTKRSIVVANYTVISAIGRLNVSEIGATSTVYVPEAHLDEVSRKWIGLDITQDDGSGSHAGSWDAKVDRAPTK
jgi:outer membrane protein